MLNIEAIVWYLFLIDSLFANIFAFSCPRWYGKNFKKYSKFFPMTRGWTLLYLGLVLWIGYSLYRMGILVW